jgi:nucleoside-diphosphate-sugar epimerase
VLAKEGGSIEIWGDGMQTRSFLYIDDCIEATRMLMKSNTFSGPVNIGSEEMVTINQLVEITAKVTNKNIKVIHVKGPTGVRGRNSNNDLIRREIGWDNTRILALGIRETYLWIQSQISKSPS